MCVRACVCSRLCASKRDKQHIHTCVLQHIVCRGMWHLSALCRSVPCMPLGLLQAVMNDPTDTGYSLRQGFRWPCSVPDTHAHN